MKTLSRLALAATLAVSLVAPAGAQDKKKAADEKAAMEAWQKAMTPGEGQKKLEPLVGSFDVKVQTWMDPSKPPDESTGTSVNTWVLGDRFVQMKYDGVFLGAPFNGIGYTGFDNVSKKYVSTWMDTASTSVLNMSGSYDKAGKVLTMTGKTDDFTTGKTTTVRSTTTMPSNDEMRWEMFAPGPDGKEVKMMEIVYTRKK